MVHRAAQHYDRGQPCEKEAAMASLCALQAASQATDEAIQIHGGYGYTTEYPVERLYRDIQTLGARVGYRTQRTRIAQAEVHS